MRIANPKDFWSGALFLITGLAFAIGALSYKLGTPAKMGSGFFPFYLGGLMAVLGFIITLRSLRGDAGERVGNIALGPLFIIVLAVCMFGLTLKTLGLIFATFVLVVIGSVADDKTSNRDTVGAAIALAVALPIATVAYLLVTRLFVAFIDPAVASVVASAGAGNADTGIVVKALLYIVVLAVKAAILIGGTVFVLRALKGFFATERAREICLLALVLAMMCCILFVDGLALQIPVTFEAIQLFFADLGKGK
jgi:hypothetical protein